MYYSPATGFTLAPVSGAVPITEAEHAALMDGQAAGQQIAPDADGRPVLVWPEPAAPTLGDARRERDRRIAAGTTVAVTGIGAIPMQGRDADMRNLQGLFGIAQLRLAAGDTDTTRFRDADNVMHDLTPAQVVELFLGGVAFVEACHAVVWAWADGPGVPADFTDPAYWP
ncbi:DUF4376 domain-containing protein [Meridianimarinicoccus sp. RP-17]